MCFSKTFLNPLPLGEIADYAIRIEFQARDSHCVIWVKDDPKFGIEGNDVVCEFIDQYVTCELPAEDGKLKELVFLLQNHKHSTYCRRNQTCHFSFPKPPSAKNLITMIDPEHVTNQNMAVLTKVQKLIADDNTNLSLSELLNKAGVTEQENIKALEVSTNGNVVVLKHEPNECSINNYNPSDGKLSWTLSLC